VRGHKARGDTARLYPNTVQDFFGFADCLYGVEYAAKCPTEHSAKVAEALQAGGIGGKKYSIVYLNKFTTALLRGTCKVK